MADDEGSDRDKDSKRDDEAEERASPNGLVLYKAIRREGDEELARPTAALFWSGLAAGLSMGFSLLAEGALRAHLPDAEWRPLVSKFGYSVGFLLVILGRQQLFTENTLTPVLPLLLRKRADIFFNLLRLWGVVLVANLLGALLWSLAATHAPAFSEEVRGAMLDAAREAVAPTFGTILVKAIFAGWLIAMIVWLLPFAEAARFWVIVAITYLVGVAELSHVIAGSVEAFALGWSGEATWPRLVGGFVLPALLGNIIGGVTFVAALNHAQVVAGKTIEGRDTDHPHEKKPDGDAQS